MSFDLLVKEEPQKTPRTLRTCPCSMFVLPRSCTNEGGGGQCVFMILNFFTSLRLLPPRFACSRPAAPAPVSLRLLAPRCACYHLAALALASLCLLPPRCACSISCARSQPRCACSEAQPRCARSESTPKL